ncbi:hypothetical protein F050043D4_15900 [Bacteroides thetaiotaomicron]
MKQNKIPKNSKVKTAIKLLLLFLKVSIRFMTNKKQYGNARSNIVMCNQKDVLKPRTFNLLELYSNPV